MTTRWMPRRSSPAPAPSIRGPPEYPPRGLLWPHLGTAPRISTRGRCHVWYASPRANCACATMSCPAELPAALPASVAVRYALSAVSARSSASRYSLSWITAGSPLGMTASRPLRPAYASPSANIASPRSSCPLGAPTASPAAAASLSAATASRSAVSASPRSSSIPLRSDTRCRSSRPRPSSASATINHPVPSLRCPEASRSSAARSACPWPRAAASRYDSASPTKHSDRPTAKSASGVPTSRAAPTASR